VWGGGGHHGSQVSAAKQVDDIWGQLCILIFAVKDGAPTRMVLCPDAIWKVKANPSDAPVILKLTEAEELVFVDGNTFLVKYN
jgi:hypothetical protein